MFGSTGTMLGRTCKTYLLARQPPPEQMTSSLHLCGQVKPALLSVTPTSTAKLLSSVVCVCDPAGLWLHHGGFHLLSSR